MSFLQADPNTGEIVDTRNLARTVKTLLDGTHSGVRAVVPLGELAIVSKRNRHITVVEPLQHLHKQPLTLVVPTGKHPLSVVYAAESDDVAAAIVRFSNGAPSTIDHAAWTFPFQDCTRFSLDSGVAAIFDYGVVNELGVAKQEEFANLLATRSSGSPALVNLPRVRWNAAVFRVAAEGNGFYSCHWAKNTNGELIAFVVDFALLA